tara:strand:+ start:195 stop:317 length:123 start_codon:yes stop_codon:yes gene_type:complete
MEQIDDIKIYKVDGLTPGNSGTGEGPSGPKNLADQVVNSA